MEPKNSREEERSLLRKHTPGGVEHDQSTHGRWSKDVFDEEVEDVIIDQNGRVLDYPYPIGKNMERERETRRRHLRKHGSSHDEKSHGNWARGGSGGMASSKKEVRDTNLHASKLRMQQRNKEKVEILDANMNASRMRMGARVGHRKMKAAMDAKGATQSVAPRNNDEAWGMMKALGEENRGSRNAFDPLNAYRGVRREFPKVKIVAISSDSSRPRASGKYRDQNLPRNEAEGAKRWNAKTFRFVSDGPEFEVEW